MSYMYVSFSPVLLICYLKLEAIEVKLTGILVCRDIGIADLTEVLWRLEVRKHFLKKIKLLGCFIL